MTDERAFDSSNMDEFPNGNCPKCGMGVMTVNGKKKCVNCSTNPLPDHPVPINRGDDPGEEGLKQALATPLAKPDYKDLEMVEMPVKQLQQLQQRANKGSVGTLSYDSHLDEVYSYLRTINVESVVKFKGLLKLQKKVLNLKNEIQLFVDAQ